MKLLKNIFIVLFNSIILVNCKEICYDDLGCFTDSKPFSGTLVRPIAVLPQSPSKINTRFFLYNRQFPDGQEISVEKIGNNFNPTLKTKIITHGYLDPEFKPWVPDMKDALLRVEDLNVILVDWTKGNGFPYTQATANTQVVGAEIAKLVKYLIQNRSVKAEDFHLIGHSLGAHIMGYAGQRVPGIGRITGLDPAGPYFEGSDPIVRLDETDAIFVDAIHTDATATIQLGLGTSQPSGHVDFFPNGGKDQPDCPTTSGKLLGSVFNLISFNTDGVDEIFSCNHIAAIYYFIDSIENKQCKYTAYPCKSESEFNKGKCIKCSSKGCNHLGYWATSSLDQGVLYLNTQSPTRKPYCKQNYQIRLVSDNLDGMKQARGQFSIYLTTGSELSSLESIDDSSATFKPDSEEIRLLSLNNGLHNGNLVSAFISYTRTGNFFTSWLYDSKWSFKFIEVYSGDEQSLVKLCPKTQFIESGSTVEFIKC